MNINLDDIIKQCKHWVDFLSSIENKETWQDELIKCLEFAIYNPEELRQSDIDDIVYTLSLLYPALVENEGYMYAILSNKYGVYVSAEQAGEAVKVVDDKLHKEERINE